MIHKRGYWSKDELKDHVFDEPLCRFISTLLKIDTCVDIGCGNGSYVDYLSDYFFCEGYDGNPLTTEITKGACYVLDFSCPQNIGNFDLVLSLEVGEHIPKKYEKIFLDNICNTSDKFVILSWAIPGQGGSGHVNCQPNEYIIWEMYKRGFAFDLITTSSLRYSSSLSWFMNTLMFFNKI